jgi:hypothetical protein
VAEVQAVPVAPVSAWLVLDKKGSIYKGFAAFLEILPRVPLLWLLTPLSLISGLRKRSLQAAAN